MQLIAGHVQVGEVVVLLLDLEVSLGELLVLVLDREKLGEDGLVLVFEHIDARQQLLPKVRPVGRILRRLALTRVQRIQLLSETGIVVDQLLREVGAALEDREYRLSTLGRVRVVVSHTPSPEHRRRSKSLATPDCIALGIS